MDLSLEALVEKDKKKNAKQKAVAAKATRPKSARTTSASREAVLREIEAQQADLLPTQNLIQSAMKRIKLNPDDFGKGKTFKTAKAMRAIAEKLLERKEERERMPPPT